LSGELGKWTRWPTRIGGITEPGDFCVARNGVALGRVLPARAIEGTLPYMWNSWVAPAQNGWAKDLEDALRQCQRAIGSAPIPEHIMRRLSEYTRNKPSGS
jgi:hypothetical protein